ncbi:MAG: BrnT family toxin [Gammaproteobacteria bacterium]|nr:BrnT family toxin [Gammaproteobacteria bacterium]MDQ7075038.1 BrnT family toxin [Gammaproteobacteria bacterium]
MNFEWDENKRHTNLNKHGVDFADAVGVFYDDMALTQTDPDHNHQEARLLTLGMDFQGRVLLVVNLHKIGDVIRIISARKANRQERKQYEG